MPRRLPVDVLDAIGALADSQAGLVRRSQLVQMGISRSTVSRLTRTGGPWQRVLPATYFVPRRELTEADRERAAIMYAGGLSLLTGNVALRHYGMQYIPTSRNDPMVHALVPDGCAKVSRGFVRIERTHRLPRPVMLHGLPLSPLPRALFDAVRQTTDRRQVQATVLEALQSERVLPAQLEAELDAGQRRWTALARETLRAFQSGTASAPEAELRELWESRQLPLIEWNATLLSLTGDFIAQTDGYDAATGMAFEVESRQYHSGPRWAKGAERHRRMASHGIVVVPVVPSQLRAEPERVLRELLLARESLLGRPLPQVVVRPFRTLGVAG